MSSPARGQGGMRPRGRGRGGSRSANNSDDDTARQSGRGKRSSSARPPSNRGAGQASARGAARSLNATLGQPNPSAGSGARGARGTGNSPRPNGFQRAPSGSFPQPSINSTLTPEQRWNEIKKRRDEERKAAMAAGIIVDPDRPRSLAEAVTPVGICLDMCPEYERLKRIQQRDYFMQELVPSTVGLDRSQHRLDEARMVKAFKRSAAGSDEQLPSDLRPPQVLQQTCQYLFDTLLNEPNQTLKSAYVFIWDRTRAIRNDFSIQQLSKISDVRLAIECLEYIARFHILTLHQIGGRPRDGDMDRYDYYQDLEQLDKTLLSLINYYHNVRNHYHSPNEAEFRAYRIIYQITAPTPDVEDNVQLWPAHLLRDTRVQTALKLYDAAQSIRQPQGPLAKRIGHPIAQANWNLFFKLAKSKQTSYLMACVAEIYFNFVRHNALRAIWRSYRTGGEGRISDGWTLAELADGLGFDSEDQVRAFVENYNFKVVQKEDGQLRLDVNSVGRSFPPPIVDRQTPQLSMSVVEPKRYGRTSTAIIYGLSVKSAFEAGMVEEGYRLKGEPSTSASAGSLLRTAPSTTVNGSSARTGFQFSSPAQTSTPTKPPTSFAFFNQSDAVGAVGSEPAQRAFNFNFSAQGPNQKESEKVKPKRGRDTLFVTGESDDEDDSVTKLENSATTLATAATPSSLNPFANAFAPTSARAPSGSQASPTLNLSSTPSPTSNPSAAISTSGPSNNFSRPVSSSRSLQLSSGQPATPATSTSNIFPGAHTTSAAKSPVFNFTGQPSSATQGPTTSFSFTPTPPKSTIDKPPITNQSAQPFAFPPSSSSTLASPTIDNKSAAPFITSTPAPTSSSPQPTQPIAADALALTASPVEQSQTIEERFLDQLAPILQGADPNVAARVMNRVQNYILDRDLVREFVDAEKEVTRLQSLSAQTGDPGARARIMKLVQEARAARAFREDLVRKQYLVQFEEEQRRKKRAAEAEREKSFAHYKGIRTQEVLRFLTRHLAFYPRHPTFGIIPTFHVRMATNIFGEVITAYEEEKLEREREAQRIAEKERLEREQRRKEKAKEMRARMKKSIQRESEKKRNVMVAQDHETAQAAFDAHLQAQRNMPSNSSRPSTAVQHHRHDTHDESHENPVGTNKSLPSNVLSTTATTEAITPSTSRTGGKRKRYDASEGSRNGDSPPTLLDLMSMGPDRGSQSASTFRSPYFRLKAAGLLPAQQRARQKRRAADADLPPAPEASSPRGKRPRRSTASTPGHSPPSSGASPYGAASSPASAGPSPAAALPQLDGAGSLPSYRSRASRFGDGRRAAPAPAARLADWAARDAALEQETQMALARVRIGGGGGAEWRAGPEPEPAPEPAPELAARGEERLLEMPRGGRGASADDAILLD